MKHTPDPWYYSDDPDPRASCADAEGCPIVATVGKYHIYTKNSTRPRPKADVRLMTASPSLLAACRAVLQALSLRDNPAEVAILTKAIQQAEGTDG